MSILLGLAAAIAWGVHDFLLRRVSVGLVVFPAIFAVLGVGLILTLPPALILADWSRLSPAAALLASLSGLFYVLASVGLYRAFGLGPVNLVAPIIGSYPIFSIGLAAWQGSPITLFDWIATLAIVTGVGLVAILAPREATSGNKTTAILWSILAAFTFFLTFAFAQASARIAGEWGVLTIGRATSVGLVAGLLLAVRPEVASLRSRLPTFAGMGMLDASAMAAVTVAGAFSHPEFAATGASIFGIVTVILARALLKEPVSVAQWGGIALTFSGVSALGL